MSKDPLSLNKKHLLVVEAERARIVKEEVACRAATLMCEAINACRWRKENWASRLINSCHPEARASVLRYRGSFGRTCH